MMTVKEVSERTGVTVRTLQHYDNIGLLHPTERTGSGYRLYDDTALEQLQQILIYRELEFSLNDIKNIINSPKYERKKALEQQIELLELKKEHIESLILFARGINLLGVKAVDFSAFDRSKLDEYSKRAREQWGNTPEFKELEEKERDRTPEEDERLAAEFMEFFAEFGAMRSGAPGSEQVQSQVKKMQSFISENLYTCSNKILAGLGKMYDGGGEISDSIDSVGGKGTATFVARAIELYCSDK